MHDLGFTRTVASREYLLQSPDAFVPTPVPGLTGGMAVVHAAPQMGAAFAMTTVMLKPGGVLRAGPVQRFVYVLEGEVLVQEPGVAAPHRLPVGGYALLPTESPHTVSAVGGQARVVLLEKPHLPLEPDHVPEGESAFPELLVGREDEVVATPLNGDEGVQVRSLVPATMAFDFAVNTMTYVPGASLSQVESHWMEHGLLMLAGGGIYRLGKDWHPVQAGDAIWMAPFCPQWFAAVGKVPAKYLIYKDFNRHVMA